MGQGNETEMGFNTRVLTAVAEFRQKIAEDQIETNVQRRRVPRNRS